MASEMLDEQELGPPDSDDGERSSGDSSEDGTRMDRRSYLKLTGLATSIAAAGCFSNTSTLGGSSLSTSKTSGPAPYFGYGGNAVSVRKDTFAAVSSELEPNDTQSDATPVESDTQLTGSLDTDDSDWFVVYADVDTQLTVDLDRQSGDGVVGILLYGPDGRLIDVVDATDGDPTQLVGTATKSGKHYIGVIDVYQGSGTYSLSIASSGSGDGGGSTPPSEPGQAPYGGSSRAIPGTVQAEDFDEGGEGVAYHDSDDVHRGTDFRSDTAVDVERSRDSTDDLSVGYTVDGEWLEYTVDVTPGMYDVHARIATPKDGRQLRIKLGDETVGVVDVPSTDGWYDWQTVTLPDVQLSGGSGQILRIETIGDGTNLNWVRFDPVQIPYGGSMATIPGTVQAEDFDIGGEGVAFHDSDDVHQGTDYRTDTPVDIERSKDSTDDLSVGYVADGEWLEYTVDVTSGRYDLQARVATERADLQLRVKLDGETVGVIDVPTTGGWYDWETTTLSDIDLSTSGQQVLRVEMEGAGCNLNWVRFAPAEPTPTSTQTSVPTSTSTQTSVPTSTSTQTSVPTSTTSPDDDFGEQGYGELGYGGVGN